MKSITKYMLLGFFVLLCNYGFSQCPCDDFKIVALEDTVSPGEAAYFTFKMTSDSSNCNSGYSDFWFIDQAGDTLNEWTGSGMWMPIPLNPDFDTAKYMMQLRPEYSSFPVDFSGILKVWNPDCTIPFTYESLLSIEIADPSSDIQISPNPGNDVIEVFNNSGTTITSFEIYDSSGKLVAHESESTDFIRIETLRPGIYFVSFYSNQTTIAVKKVIKK